MKLSVIVPVFQVEATLDRCVASIVGQTSTDLEVILVDDCSPDCSPKLCDEWAAKDSRILVVHHQSNRGLSAARNTGIERATGELITFVDSDDFLKEDTYQAIMPLAETHDIVEFPVSRFPSPIIYRPSAATYTAKQAYWLETQAYTHTYAWNKIYKRSLFDHIRFPEGQVFEDVATFPQLLQAAKDICTTCEGMYYYTLSEKGITATAREKELTSLLDSHVQTLRQWHDASYYMHVLNIQMDVCELTGEAPILPFQRINPLAKGLTAKLRLKALALNLFGINGICKINKTIHQWKKPRS